MVWLINILLQANRSVVLEGFGMIYSTPFCIYYSDGRVSGRALKPAHSKPFLTGPARPRPEGDKPESPRALADKLGNPILVETML